MQESKPFTQIPEELITRYFTLSEKAKEIEKELKEMKKVLNVYFDETVGKHEKGESFVGDFKIQRQIRWSESYHDEKMVKRLEELNLNDCIQVIKQPDQQKIEAAITLGLLGQADIEDCILKKTTNAITVRKM
ncbi:hypothetical protein RGU12_01030 [Fredinandcohnia sp. QZ13]|uniref:hypothetical protein n=1 Tax=Fredinandcohnia sp. QZ13 TaxID=3073144 RepID=UPI0028537278|nr:hypothetical protein [Fredinandcohnia sp. QZ13]MDR4886127.1 hypothetical protein [Fredinandcohnia sp. QZ13]